jgi:Septin family protein
MGITAISENYPLSIHTHVLDLITTGDSRYENYRQQQMETRKVEEPEVKKADNPKFKEEEEQLRKRLTEQVKAEEARFRQWDQHVSFRCCTASLDSMTGLICNSLQSAIAWMRARQPAGWLWQ